MQEAGHSSRPTAGDTVTTALGLIAVLGATVFVIWQLRPDLLFNPNMDVGGDNAGHIVTPYFLIHDLLPQGRITGWDPQWFEGFPLYVFYFPLPALFVAALSLVFSYAVAFKLVTVLGLVTLPAAAWLFGHLAAFKRPVPVLMAASMLPFLFNTSYTIDGGNITSTLAGEFSFSLALTSGLLFLGVFAFALRTGRLRWLAAVLYAVTLLCHVVPAIAFAAVATLMAIAHWNKRTWRVLLPVGLVGGLLAAFWLVPFGVDLPYGSSMGYTRVLDLWSNIMPDRWTYLWVLVPTAIGLVMAVIRRNRTALVLAVAIVASAVGFQWLPAGFIYNGRWLPFYFLFTALLAAYGIGELFRFVGRWLQLDEWQAPRRDRRRRRHRHPRELRRGGYRPTWACARPRPRSRSRAGSRGTTPASRARPAGPSTRASCACSTRRAAPTAVGGCSTSTSQRPHDPFGSTEATMALPYWTNGCMDTIDGVLFESSTTTPFHFLDQAEYSLPGRVLESRRVPDIPILQPRRRHQAPPVRGRAVLPGRLTPGRAGGQVGPRARQDRLDTGFPGLDQRRVRQRSRLGPLPHQGLAARDAARLPARSGIRLSANQWLDTNLTWWEDESYWPVELCAERPGELAQSPCRHPGADLPGRPVKPTTVSDAQETNSTVSFDVGRLGSPVLVKVPYFPNWQATGALGPYEVSPNLMAVVPTAHHVTLTYGTTRADQLGKLASLGGVVGLGMLMTLRPPVMSRPPSCPRTCAQRPTDDAEPEGVVAADDEDDRAPLAHRSPSPSQPFARLSLTGPLPASWGAPSRSLAEVSPTRPEPGPG